MTLNLIEACKVTNYDAKHTELTQINFQQNILRESIFQILYIYFNERFPLSLMAPPKPPRVNNPPLKALRRY